MLRLLIITNEIPHYRVPIYNEISKIYQTDIYTYGVKIKVGDVNYKYFSLPSFRIGNFILFNKSIFKLSQKYDIVLLYMDFHCPQLALLSLFRKRKFALVNWSIGVSASYTKKYDEDKKWDWIRFKLMNRGDAMVFYSDYPIKRYADFGIDTEKLFVAHNTVQVTERVEISLKKEHFLFVGSLYKEKNIYELLSAYLEVRNLHFSIPPLVIIGDGSEKRDIEKWVSVNKLGDFVKLKGAIYDDDELKFYYKSAIASISPNQAGLSVLSSFGYGVPFVTSVNAITGGERFNIIDGYNGYLYYNKDNLTEILLNLSKDSKLVSQLSLNAQDYYFKNRTMEVMLRGLKNSIDFACRKKNKLQFGCHNFIYNEF